jgi:hypothetical protein
MNRWLLLYPLSLAVMLFGCGSDGGDEAASTNTSTSASGSGSGGSGSGGESGSGGSGGGESGSGGGGGAAVEDLDMKEADFECLLDWTAVRKFRITNKLGHTDETLAVANSADGGVYPVGTVIQLIPTEAMVKRRAGFSADTKDWEFFFLEVTGKTTTIKARGTKDVVNGFGGNCLNCHAKAEPKWDFICEDTHGCDPIPVTPQQIKEIQDGDPRCVP